MKRARACLGLYFVPDEEPAEKARKLDLFARALRFTPKWAVSQAFDRWERENTHRPTPGHIIKLARQAIKHLRDELKARTPQDAGEPRREPRIPAEEAERMVQAAGFTPKRIADLQRRPMASPADLKIPIEDLPKPPHWTETADPDGPEMQALRKARDENPLIQQARADAERKRLKMNEKAG